MITTEYEGIEYTHRVLWRIVTDQAELAAARDRGWFNPTLVSMVFAFHRVEAFVNFVVREFRWRAAGPGAVERRTEQLPQGALSRMDGQAAQGSRARRDRLAA
jgi:hypothetical protein